MKKTYLHTTHRVLMALFWACLLMSQTTWAQSIPDAQWARVGRTLDITSDGNIVTGETIYIPNNPGFPGQGGDRLVKYSLRGDQIWSTGLLKGGYYLGGKIQGFDYESIGRITASVASSDGGVTVAGPLNLRGGTDVAVKVNKDGVSGSWQETDIFFTNFNTDVPSDMVATSNGGFIILSSATASQPNTPSTVILRRYTAGKQLVWTKQIAYPGSASPDVSLTKGNSIINTPDGGFLVVGFYNQFGANSLSSGASEGWMAKLDADGNVSWQKLISAPGPNYSKQLSTITDAIVSADGAGYALIGRIYTDGTRLVEIDGNGNVRSGRTKFITLDFTDGHLTPYISSGGKKHYAVGNTTTQSGRLDPQLRLVDPTNLSVVAGRTFPGPGSSRLTDIATAGDGSLVFVTDNNQLVKLQPEPTTQPPVGALALTAPTYNCATGAFTFNTSGGNGSPIEYAAAGITGWTNNPNQFVDKDSRTANDVQPFTLMARQNGVTVSYVWDLRAYCNGTPPPPVTPPPVNPPIGGSLALIAPTYNCATGAFTFNTSGGNGTTIEYAAPGITGWTNNPNQFVDKDSRTANDVQPFTLMARQNGVTVSYVWDLRAYCNGTPTPKPPVLSKPIPDLTLKAGESTYFPLAAYFADPTTGIPDYRPNWFVNATGLPPGLSLFVETVESMFTLAAVIVGTPTTAGRYPVTVTAGTHASGSSVSTSFTIIVLPKEPLSGHQLTLLAPDYKCATGEFTFNHFGGNGSTIEYAAAGITGWTTSPFQFVDKDSRTANDVQPFTLMARQSGLTVTYVWDLKAACGRSARTAALPEPGTQLRVRVLGNPVLNQTAEIDITGAEQQVLHLNLVDLQGKVLHQQRIEQADPIQRVRVPIGAQPGLFLLNVSTVGQSQQVRLVKP